MLRRRHVGDPRGLVKLASNPLMLEMLSFVYFRTNTIPPNRGQLFDDFVTQRLVREGLAGTATDKPTEEGHALLTGLEDLAVAMLTGAGDEGALTVMPTADAEAVTTAQVLLLGVSTSLLSMGAEVRFTHQLLQEYFAARQLRDRIASEQLAATTLWPPERWWERSGWEEVAVLLVGLGGKGSTELLLWVAEGNPEVAADCVLRSGVEVPEATLRHFRDLWLSRLTDVKYEPAPESRAAVGRALGLMNLDDRQGVGMTQDPDGRVVPDIDWLEIPGGGFTYQKDTRLSLDTAMVITLEAAG